MRVTFYNKAIAALRIRCHSYLNVMQGDENEAKSRMR